MEHKTKKALKIAGITAGSFLAVIILVVAIAAAIIFSPKRLTPVASKLLDKYFPGKAEISSVGITYWKTRPYLGIDIKGVTVYDGMEGSPFDKILEVNSLAASFDLKSFLKENKFIIKGVFLDGTHANLYKSPSGTQNIDFLLPESPKEDEPEDTTTTLIYADLHEIAIKGLNAAYRDDSSLISAVLEKASMDMRGMIHQDSIDVSISAKIKGINASVADSSTTSQAQLANISMKASAVKFDENGSITANLETGKIAASSGEMAAQSKGMKLNGSDLKFSLDGYSLNSISGTISAIVNEIHARDNQGMVAHTGDLVLDLDHFTFSNGIIDLAKLAFTSEKIEFDNTSSDSRTTARVDSIRLIAKANCDTAMTDIASNIALYLGDIQFVNKDDTSSIDLMVKRPSMNAGATIKEGNINLSTTIATSGINTMMNGESMTDNWPLMVNIPSLDTDTAITFITLSESSSIEVNGQIIQFGAKATKKNDRIAGNASARIKALDIEKVISMIPESYRSALDGIDVKGITDIEAKVNGAWSDAGAELHKINANLSASDFYASLNDSVKVNADKLDAMLESPDGHAATADISGNILDVLMVSESLIHANMKDIRLKANIKDIADSLMAMTASAQIDVKNIQASMDTISATLEGASISADMFNQSEKPTFSATVGFDRLNARLGEGLNAAIGKTTMDASAQYDSTETDILGKWDPKVNFTVERSNMDMLDDPIVLEGLDVNFSQGSFNIKEGKVSLGNSNIELWGDIYNIGPFMRDEGLLTGELYLESDFVDVTQLMEYTSGMGQEDADPDKKTAELPTDTIISDTIDAIPFVVPRGIDLALYTNFSEIEFNHHIFNNVGGDVTIKDGKVIMQEVGFSSNTAEMQLTAIYDAPEEDNRFIELDFHLLDIQIDELIDLIPSVDSIVPMLKAFKGEAQFHLAAETKLQRDNMPKMSTLLGAAVIEGKDLVIMDNEVFKGIKRKLLMSRKAQNKIDDLNIEMQVFRDKVDLYPFLIHMDKYNAVIGGRHNINKGLDCRYHISLTDSPLPFRLGVTVSGPITEISEKPLKHIKIARCEYDKLFKPSRRSDVEERTLAIRKDIAETLKSNVR